VNDDEAADVAHGRAPRVRVRLLGQPSIVVLGREVHLGKTDLMVLAALVHLGEVTDSEQVRELVWVGSVGKRALQSAVFRLRRVLGDDAVITRRNAVGLDLSVVESDAEELLQVLQSITIARPDAAQRRLAEDLCAGSPFTVMAEHPAWVGIRELWTDRVNGCHRWLIDGLVADGQIPEAVLQARKLVARSPETPRHWAMLANLLALDGRRTDALRTIEAARRELAGRGLPLDATLKAVHADLVNDHLPAVPPPQRLAAPLGRDREYQAAVAALDASPTSAVLLEGPRGIGKSFLARSLLRRSVQMGARVVEVRGDEGGMRSAAEVLRQLIRQLAPGLSPDGEPVDVLNALTRALNEEAHTTLISIEDAHHLDEGALSEIGMLAASTARRSRLLVTARGDSRVEEILQRSTAVEVISLSLFEGPAIHAFLAHAGVHGSHEQVTELAAASGGLPSLVHSYAETLRRSADSQLSLRTVVRQRMDGLEHAVRQVVRAASLTTRGVSEAAVARLAHDVGRPTLQLMADAVASRLVVLDEGRLSVAQESIRQTVAEALDPAARAELADALFAVGSIGDSLPDRLDQATYLLLGSQPRRFARAEQILLRAVSQVDPLDSAGRDRAVTQALALMRGLGAQPSDMIGLMTEAAITDYLLRPDAWHRAMRRTYQAALGAGDRSKVVQMLRVMSRNRHFTNTLAGEEFRSVAVELLREGRLSPYDTATVQAVVAFFEAARHSPQRARVLMETALASARSLSDPDLVWWMLRSIVSIESSDRSFEDLAEELIDLATARGDLHTRFEAKMYLACARLRRQEISFTDPSFAELKAMAVDGRSAYVQSMWLLVEWHQLRVRGDEHGAQRLLESMLVIEHSPDLTRALELRQRLGASGDFLQLDPATLIGDLAEWGSDAPIDVLVYQLCRWSSAGDHTSVRTALTQLQQPVSEGRTSRLQQFRLPLLVLVVHRLDDAEIARRMLELHLPLRGTEFVMLLSAHLGPAEVWLARLAAIAGDPRHDELAQAAADRLAQHVRLQPPG